MVHEFRDLGVIKDGIRQDHMFFWFCFSHCSKTNVFVWVAFSVYFNTSTEVFTQPLLLYPTNQKLKFNILLFFGSIRFLLLLSCFRTLSTIFAAALSTTSHTGCIQGTTYDVVTNSRQIFHTTTSYQYDRVFL